VKRIDLNIVENFFSNTAHLKKSMDGLFQRFHYSKSNSFRSFMKLHILLLLLALALISGCSTYGFPPAGFIYSKVAYPAGDKTKLDATTATKQGASSCKGIMGAVAWGDCSVEAAMQEGGLTKIHHVEHRSTNIYIFYSRFDTLVFGE